MSLYIHFPTDLPVSGPNTFMSNLKGYLERQDFQYVTTPSEADGIFFPISFDKDTVKQIRGRGGRVIQRLDGVFYPSKHGAEYQARNSLTQEIYQELATTIVFQSEYSKQQCFSMFGEKSPEEYAIIVNGVDKALFYPNDTNSQLPPQVRFVTTGNFRNIDMLVPTIQALDSLRGKFDFVLKVVGPISDPSLEPYLQREYVQRLGSHNLKEVADVLRDSDIFIYSHLNPPCPNSVIEAISVGLPVVGFDSGSMKELSFFNTDLLAPVNDEIFQKYEDLDYQELAVKLELGVSDYSAFRARSLAHANLYDFEECGRRYLEIFKYNK